MYMMQKIVWEIALKVQLDGINIETVRFDLEAIEMIERIQRQNLNYIQYLEKENESIY